MRAEERRSAEPSPGRASGGHPPPFVPPALALFVATIAFSWSGPLVRLSSAPSLAIAVWRLIFAVLLISLVLLVRRSFFLGVSLSRREWGLAIASGVFLATHFWSWIASLKLTTVASSVVLVSTHPFWIAALSVLFLGERPSPRQWMGILIAMGGVASIGWSDFAVGGTALWGDLLALAAAFLAAAYYTIGRKLRRKLDLWAYVGVVYGVAMIVLASALLLSPEVPIADYSGRDWWIFAALAIGPMMLGHTGVNYAIRYIPAFLANLVILGEAVGAIVIAALLPSIGETPSRQVLVGAVLILSGIAVATLERRRGPSRNSSPRGPGGTEKGGGGRPSAPLPPPG